MNMNSHEMVLWYLGERGVKSLFLAFIDGLQVRYGQAFFNVLPTEDRELLRGSIWDPFYSDEPFDCALAIMNVLTK